ncbi:MAG: hypothetical protein NVS2B12_42560 [Ktedonobacteraceae bacterium]
MPTDYVLFNHGVTTREIGRTPTYANKLIELIQSHYHLAPERTLKPIVLYWGDLGDEEEQKLLTIYRASPYWKEIWFRSTRETLILQSIGDAALYLSRYVGAKVVDRVQEQTLAGLAGFDPKEDRLHLVTHSVGTVILFDMLFSARWDPDYVPGHASIEIIRDLLFGMGLHPESGIRLGSVTTMGSPLGIFSLLDVDTRIENTSDDKGHVLNTHDITPRLEKLLMSLRNELGTKLPWHNFMHPGDPIGYPLAQLLPLLVDRNNQYIDIQDILVPPIRLLDKLFALVSQSPIAILDGLTAHNEYYRRDDVAQKIAEGIEKASRPLAIAMDQHQG